MRHSFKVAAACAAMLSGPAGTAAAAEQTTEWDFKVYLDDRRSAFIVSVSPGKTIAPS